MSFAPALPVPCVLRHAVRSAARALATTPKYKAFLVFMNPPLNAAEGRGKSDYPVRRSPEPMLFRAPECTFPAVSASRVGPQRIGRPSVQCAHAQPRARDDRIFRRELFHQALPG